MPFVSSTQATGKAPAIWNILSQAGRRVGILGVPGTYPPEPVNGFMVSGFDSPWRPGWMPRSFTRLAVSGSAGMAFRGFPGKPYRTGLAHAGIARAPGWDRCQRGDSDPFAGPGTLGFLHGRVWRVRYGFPPFLVVSRSPFPTACSRTRRCDRQVYERLDQTVGRLIAAAGDDVVVAVVSDHGFGGAGTGVVHLNNWLAENAYLTFGRSRQSCLKRAALRWVPEGWRGALFRRFGDFSARLESRGDWAGSIGRRRGHGRKN